MNFDNHFGDRILPAADGADQIADTAGGIGIPHHARVNVYRGI